jgi:hypothetical protein
MQNIVVFIFIIVIVILFGSWLSKFIIKARANKILKATGNKISAIIDCIKVSITNGRDRASIMTSRIHCIYKNPQTNQVTEYESDDLILPYLTIPDINILEKPAVDVYIDKNDPKKYYVDISNVKVRSVTVPPLKGQFDGFGLFVSHDGENFSMETNYEPKINI